MMVMNYVVYTLEKMTKEYTHLTEEYARKTAERLNGLCGVRIGLENKMESIEKNLTLLKTYLLQLLKITN